MRIARAHSIIIIIIGGAAIGCASERAPARATSEPPTVEPRAAVVSSITPAPIATASVAIDLPTVLELAGEKPNAIRLARERLAEADASADRALADVLPSIAIGGVFTQHFGVAQQVDGKFIDEVRKQRLFLGGGSYVQLDAGGLYAWLAARQRRRAFEEDVEAAVQDRGLAAADAYFELVGAQAALAIARDALEHARAFLDLARARERSAVGLRVDTLRAEADVASARRDVIAGEERFRVASAQLASILRLDATVTLFTAETRVHPLTFFAPDAAVDGLIAIALGARPDLRAQEERVATADLERDAARFGPFLPKLLAGTGPAFAQAQGQTAGLGFEGENFAQLRDREDYFVGAYWSLSGLGLGEFAEARRRDARLRAERVVADDLRERIVREVIEAREAVRSRRATIDVAEDELRAAEEARAITTKRLEQGAGLAVEVLAAEEARTRAATHLVDAVVGYDRAQYRLLVRVGRRPASAAR